MNIKRGNLIMVFVINLMAFLHYSDLAAEANGISPLDVLKAADKITSTKVDLEKKRSLLKMIRDKGLQLSPDAASRLMKYLPHAEEKILLPLTKLLVASNCPRDTLNEYIGLALIKVFSDVKTLKGAQISSEEALFIVKLLNLWDVTLNKERKNNKKAGAIASGLLNLLKNDSKGVLLSQIFFVPEPTKNTLELLKTTPNPKDVYIVGPYQGIMSSIMSLSTQETREEYIGFLISFLKTSKDSKTKRKVLEFLTYNMPDIAKYASTSDNLTIIESCTKEQTLKTIARKLLKKLGKNPGKKQ